MTDFGGLGGIAGGREIDDDDLFEAAVARCLGERLRAPHDHKCGGWFRCDHIAARLWGTLANASFHHDNGDTASYSFRAAGDLIAAVRGEGDYMEWYCSQDYDLRDPEVIEALAGEGWHIDPETSS